MRKIMIIETIQQIIIKIIVINMEDLSVSILIDNKNNVSNPIKIPKRKTSIWIPDHKVNSCFSCNERFNIIKRKHHCRLCGRIYCHSCTTYIRKINELLISTTPPSDVFSSNYIYDKLGVNWWSADVRICKECEKDAKIIDKSELYIVLFSIIQVKITDLMRLRLVCKEWCSSINHILSAFRSIQYKLSNQKFSRLEKNILWTHRYEFHSHYYWISKCITANSDRNSEELEDLIQFYISDNSNTLKCNHLLCRSDCQKFCKSEDILELCFYSNLKRNKCVEKLIVHELIKQDEAFFVYILPWLIEISKTSMEIGWELVRQCVVSRHLSYLFYFETKIYINTLTTNKNLKDIISKFNIHIEDKLRDEIRKTDEFMKFIKLLLTKDVSFYEENINYWFKQNLYVALPWNPSLLCVGVDYRNIRQLTSNSRPYIVPLIICKKSGNQKVKYIKNILIKHEDLRKDKLTMYVTRWINILCTELITMKTYNIVCYDIDYGWIEMVPNTITLFDIEQNGQTLTNYIMDNNPNSTAAQLRHNFIETCVGACVLCYILGVGDRHKENILINDKGEIINVDFSFILGKDPKHVNTEMRITSEMLEMLGGKNSNNFIKFKSKCIKIYKKIRKYSNLWFLLLSYLAFNEPMIDDFWDDYIKIKKHVIERLVPGEFDDESSTQIVEIVEKSSGDSYVQRFTDLTHSIAKKTQTWTGMFQFD